MKNKINWWTNFNYEHYIKYLIEKEKHMNTYKITYKYYKGNNDIDFEPLLTHKYVLAYNKQEAIKLFGLWEKLIVKIEKL